jgi:carbon storage regulator CsrA
MLILSRKANERVNIYDRASNKVLMSLLVTSVHGKLVKLGFVADDSILILREEVDPKKEHKNVE